MTKHQSSLKWYSIYSFDNPTLKSNPNFTCIYLKTFVFFSLKPYYIFELAMLHLNLRSVKFESSIFTFEALMLKFASDKCAFEFAIYIWSCNVAFDSAMLLLSVQCVYLIRKYYKIHSNI